METQIAVLPWGKTAIAFPGALDFAPMGWVRTYNWKIASMPKVVWSFSLPPSKKRLLLKS